VGSLRSPYAEEFNGGLLAGFAACNFRMNEFTGAVLKGQVQKLGTICSRLRANARKVREGIADLPAVKLRKSPDVEGDLGSTIFLVFETRSRCDRFKRAMAAEGVPAHGPGGSAILPADPRIANKATIHPDWPSFQSPQGKAIRYGAESCPRTIDILGRSGGVVMDPNFSEEEVGDIVKAIRKVYLALGQA
jgi:8-amino-3,8-dideoxy-alpha-D-manno-octulosonate transaminase